MIPVFFLDIEGNHKVLDMCAAPGMKTTQLLENLTLDTDEPPGVVMANDTDRNRAFMLVHTLKRLRTPAFMVVHHDARHIPTLKTTDKKEILFDRVLCDVPCSGDGTLRKSPDAWAKWTPTGGLNLHKIQVGIGMRGASLLKVGGSMVYSTCSFNPVENEAGVAELLRLSNGCLELQDMSDRLPDLKRAPGMHSWKIMGKDRVIYDKFEDCADPREAMLMPSMFSPSAEDAKAMHLERCMRLVPSHQDTGGFFVAVLKKVKPFNMNPTKVQMVLAKDPFATVDPSMAEADGDGEEEEQPAVEKSDDICKIYEKFGRCKYGANCKFQHKESEDGDKPLKAKSDTGGEEALTQLSASHSDVVEKLQRQFGLEDFPADQLFTRSSADTALPRTIYYVSEAIKEMISCDFRGRLHVINCGVKAFERVELKDPVVIAPYRVCQEMTKTLLPHMKKRKLKCGIRCFQNLLTRNNHEVSSITRLDTDSPEPLLQQLEAVDVGTLIIYADHNGGVIAMSCFKGKEKLQLYVGKDETEALKAQLTEAVGPAEPIKPAPEPEVVVEPAVAMEEKEPTHVTF